MIQFISYASGSRANLYEVRSGDTRILLEAGLRLKEIKGKLNYELSQIDAVFITHSHKDHALSAEALLKAGKTVYMLAATQRELEINNHHRLKLIDTGETVRIGSMNVLAFETEHDVESLGFLITDGQDKLCFATDTYYIRYRFKGITILAVECNYDEQILEQNILNGEVPALLKRRLARSHFNFENYKQFLRMNDLSKVREIHMIHMSSSNSDPEAFKKEVAGMTGAVIKIP